MPQFSVSLRDTLSAFMQTMKGKIELPNVCTETVTIAAGKEYHCLPALYRHTGKVVLVGTDHINEFELAAVIIIGKSTPEYWKVLSDANDSIDHIDVKPLGDTPQLVGHFALIAREVFQPQPLLPLIIYPIDLTTNAVPIKAQYIGEGKFSEYQRKLVSFIYPAAATALFGGDYVTWTE